MKITKQDTLYGHPSYESRLRVGDVSSHKTLFYV